MEAVQKQRRSVIKRKNKEAVKAEKASSVVAKLTNIPTSTRKMRLVADLVRGESVNKALSILKFQPKQGARKLEKLLFSAIANWQLANEDAKIEEADLYVKEIFVDGGRMLKRLRPAPQGRAFRVRKRSNHVTLVLGALTSQVDSTESNEPKTAAKAVEPARKATKAKANKTSKTDKE